MTIHDLIARWRVRRHVWFCLYYRPAKPLPASMSATAWSSLMELDNQVLGPCQDAGLLEKFWQSHPPTVDGYYGGFSDDVMTEYVKPEDLVAIGFKPQALELLNGLLTPIGGERK